MKSAFPDALATPAGTVVPDRLGKFLPVGRIKAVINRHGLGSFPLRQQRGVGDDPIKLHVKTLDAFDPLRRFDSIGDEYEISA